MFVQLIIKAEEGIGSAVTQANQNPGQDYDKTDAIELEQKCADRSARVKIYQRKVDTAGSKQRLQRGKHKGEGGVVGNLTLTVNQFVQQLYQQLGNRSFEEPEKQEDENRP